MIEQNSGIELSQIEILKKEDTNRNGCPKTLKELVKKSKGEIVCFLGDDTLPQKDFLKNSLDAMNNFKDNWGLIGFNDLSGRNLPLHWLGHKKLLKYLDGEFFHTGYKHCYCDNELWDRCADMGRYLYCLNAIVKHDHPLFTGKEADEDYKRVYSQEYMQHDKELYLKRKANNWRS